MNLKKNKKEAALKISEIAQEGMVCFHKISQSVMFCEDVRGGTQDSVYWRNLKTRDLQALKSCIARVEEVVNEMESFMSDYEHNGWHYWSAVHPERSVIPHVNVSYQVKVMFDGRRFFFYATWDGYEWKDDKGEPFELFDLIDGYREWQEDYEE